MKLKLKDKGAISTMEIVGIAVALLMLVIIMPIALNEIGGAVGATAENENISNAENWGAARDTFIVIVGTVIPLIAILGLAMKFLGK